MIFQAKNNIFVDKNVFFFIKNEKKHVFNSFSIICILNFDSLYSKTPILIFCVCFYHDFKAI